MTLTFIAGCGYREGIIQQDLKSYLWFTGETENALVFIDDKEPFALQESNYAQEDAGRKTHKNDFIHYQLAPGKHKIVVKKNGRIVVDRVLILGGGMTKEISIP